MSMPLDIKICDDGTPPNVWVARIKHESVDGCHIFTSDDISGLLVASRDPLKALGQLKPTIQALIHKNHGMNWTVDLGDEFKEFEKAHNSPLRPRRKALKDTYAVIRQTEKVAA